MKPAAVSYYHRQTTNNTYSYTKLSEEKLTGEVAANYKNEFLILHDEKGFRQHNDLDITTVNEIDVNGISALLVFSSYANSQNKPQLYVNHRLYSFLQRKGDSLRDKYTIINTLMQ